MLFVREDCNMNINRILCLCMAFCYSFIVFGQSRECPYCKGRGTIVKNLTVSQFGWKNESKVKCNECGIYSYPSSGHSHIHCKHCRGTGHINNGSNTRDSYSEADDPNSPLAAWGREIAATLRYGLPVNEAEDAAFRHFAQVDPESAKKYLSWRNLLNATAVYYNRCSALLIHCNVQSLDQTYNDVAQKLSQYSYGVALSPELKSIVDQLNKQYNEAFMKYRNYCVAKQSLDELENQVIDWRLQQLLW